MNGCQFAEEFENVDRCLSDFTEKAVHLNGMLVKSFDERKAHAL